MGKSEALRAFAALVEDLSSGPSIYIDWLTATCDFNSKGFNTAFGLREYLYIHTHK